MAIIFFCPSCGSNKDVQAEELPDVYIGVQRIKVSHSCGFETMMSFKR